MKKILDYFTQIVSIPHCSREASALGEYLADFARGRGFSVQIDSAGNILCTKGSPKVCLQSHYDMVCVGTAPQIDMYESDGYLMARGSSLGADNGIGIAIMMAMMDRYGDLECLFTSDEEIGLVGANAFDTPLQSPYLLNLDSECEDQIIIGCAASYELSVSKRCHRHTRTKPHCYELSTKGFVGGHSGIDIAKGIRSAIPTLLSYIYQHGFELASIDGGERANSISVGAKAVVFSDSIIDSAPDWLEIRALADGGQDQLVFARGDLARFVSFRHGVYEYDESLRMPKLSANFSFIHTNGDEIGAVFYARSDDDELLDGFGVYVGAVFDGFDIKELSRDKAWQSVQSEFSSIVLECLRARNERAYLASIHAGLECGVLRARQPHIQCASIGPNIHYPHSINERCEIRSVELIASVVDDLLSKLSCARA